MSPETNSSPEPAQSPQEVVRQQELFSAALYDEAAQHADSLVVPETNSDIGPGEPESNNGIEALQRPLAHAEVAVSGLRAFISERVANHYQRKAERLERKNSTLPEIGAIALADAIEDGVTPRSVGFRAKAREHRAKAKSIREDGRRAKDFLEPPEPISWPGPEYISWRADDADPEPEYISWRAAPTDANNSSAEDASLAPAVSRPKFVLHDKGDLFTGTHKGPRTEERRVKRFGRKKKFYVSNGNDALLKVNRTVPKSKPKGDGTLRRSGEVEFKPNRPLEMIADDRKPGETDEAYMLRHPKSPNETGAEYRYRHLALNASESLRNSVPLGKLEEEMALRAKERVYAPLIDAIYDEVLQDADNLPKDPDGVVVPINKNVGARGAGADGEVKIQGNISDEDIARLPRDLQALFDGRNLMRLSKVISDKIRNEVHTEKDRIGIVGNLPTDRYKEIRTRVVVRAVVTYAAQIRRRVSDDMITELIIRQRNVREEALKKAR